MQLKAQSSSGFSCGTDQMYHKMIAEHPEYLAIEQQLEQETAQFAMQNQAMATVYVIPVVFHIIHSYGPENISDAQVQDAIRLMNEDFRKLPGIGGGDGVVFHQGFGERFVGRGNEERGAAEAPV